MSYLISLYYTLNLQLFANGFINVLYFSFIFRLVNTACQVKHNLLLSALLIFHVPACYNITSNRIHSP